MLMVAQILVNGLIVGAIYALVALGFSLIYSTNKFVHFAHGSVVAFSAYLLYFLFSSLEWNFGLSVVLSIVFACFLGCGVNILIYQQLRKRKTSASILLIASFGIMIFLDSLILLLFGADVKSINIIKAAKGIEILGVLITPLQIFIMLISAAILLTLYFLLYKTRVGKTMRAVSDNKDYAEIIGISSEKTYVWSLIIGSAIAGIAGVLIGLEQNLEPMMGTNLMVKGFAAAIIGGIDSIYGAFIGALLLGILENISVWYLPSGYKDAIAFVVLFIFLICKPTGIFGVKRRDEK